MDVVIGAAFGDEGKGLMTHYFASQYGRDAIVVRFNGGAQAGHTVVTEEGQRHIFRHVGSGAFAGAATFLSRFFVANPILFLEELKQLQAFNLHPIVYIDPDALITTPYDMMVNQIVEEARGAERHGSCGVGFAETIERNTQPRFSLTVSDIENKPKVSAILQLIRKEWLPQRLKALKITSVSSDWQVHIASDEIMDFYLHQIDVFLAAVTICSIDLSQTHRPIIFEGAQGLMLDQSEGYFPHVTRSHTGLKNIMSLIQGRKVNNLNVTYVTRTYLTRHGAGPLPNELFELPYPNVKDTTNIANTHQGALRYAWFNLTLLKSFIEKDRQCIPSGISIKPKLAVTCLDQVGEQITFIQNNKMYKTSQSIFLARVSEEMALGQTLCSYGPTIDRIRVIE